MKFAYFLRLGFVFFVCGMLQACDWGDTAFIETNTETEASALSLEREKVLAEIQLELLEAEQSGEPVSFTADVVRMKSALNNFLVYDNDRGTVLILGELSFAPNATEVSSVGVKALRRMAKLLLKHPSGQVVIEGHADAQGDPEVNQQLSLDRAYAVRDVLVAYGVSARRMPVHGFSDEQPLSTNLTADGRQRNRRVEIIILGAHVGAHVSTAENEGQE